MTRTTTTNFKAKMGQYMRAVREGTVVVLTDRGAPIARVVRYEAAGEPTGTLFAIPRDPTAPPLGELVVCPIEWRGRSTTELLAEDRRR